MEPSVTFKIRQATSEDLPQVIELDEKNTGLRKPFYWEDLFERFGRREKAVSYTHLTLPTICSV